MSDFLTRLAQRQLGMIATIEPRLSGLYAPVADETAFATMSFGTEHQTDTEVEQWNVSMSRQLSKRSPFPPPAVSPEPLTGAPPAQRPVVENRQTTERPLRNPAESGDEKAPWTSDNQRPAEIPPLVSEELSVKHRSLDLLSEAWPRVSSNEPAQVEKPRFVDSEKSTAQAPARLVEQTAPNNVAVPQSLHALSERASVPRRATQLQDLARDGAQPPVHVTIGRIEVSAVTASAPPKRASTAPKPSMSLDAYLARRQRRER